MTENNNIDKIFKTAAAGFSATTPSGAWQRMESALTAKRRRRILFWWLFAAIMGVSLFVAALLWFGDSSVTNNSSQNKIEDKLPDNEKNTNNISLENSNEKNTTQKEITSNSGLENSTIEQEKEKSPSANKIESKKKILSSSQISADKIAHKSHIQNNQTKTSSQQQKINKNIESPSIKLAEDSILKAPEVSQTTTGKQSNLVIQESAQIHPNILEDSLSNSTKTNTLQIIDNQAVEDDSIINIDTLSSPPENKQEVKKSFQPSFCFALNFGFIRSGAFMRPPELSIKTTVSTYQASPHNSFGKGFSAAFFVSPKWMVTAQFQAYKMMTSGALNFPNHNLKYIKMENFGYTPAGYYDADYIETTMESKGFATLDYLKEFTDATTSIQANTFSVGVGRYFGRKKWMFSYHASVNMALLSQSEVYYNNLTGKSLFGEIKDVRNQIFGFSFGGDISYSIDNHLFIGINTRINFFVNSVNTSQEFGYYPWSYFLGPQMGLRF